MATKYTKELLEPLVKIHFSVRSICITLGVKPSSGTQSNISKRIKEHKLDTSHFTGKGHAIGKIIGPRRSIEAYLNNEVGINSHALRLRLIKEGLKEKKCEICNLDKWNGTDIPLELDHVDRDHYNNNLSNLQVICPNCHAVKTANDKKMSL